MNTQSEVILSGSTNTIANAMSGLQFAMLKPEHRAPYDTLPEEMKVIIKKMAHRINSFVAMRYMVTDQDAITVAQMATCRIPVTATELGFVYCKAIHELWSEGFSDGIQGDLEKKTRQEYLEGADAAWVALVGNHDGMPKSAIDPARVVWEVKVPEIESHGSIG